MSANSRQHGGSHYQVGAVQHWDYVEHYRIPYLEACSTKYLGRWWKKNSLQDLEKSVHYLEKALERSSVLWSQQGSRPSLDSSIADSYVLGSKMNSYERTIFYMIHLSRTADSMEMALLRAREYLDLMKKLYEIGETRPE